MIDNEERIKALEEKNKQLEMYLQDLKLKYDNLNLMVKTIYQEKPIFTPPGCEEITAEEIDALGVVVAKVAMPHAIDPEEALATAGPFDVPGTKAMVWKDGELVEVVVRPENHD